MKVIECILLGLASLSLLAGCTRKTKPPQMAKITYRGLTRVREQHGRSKESTWKTAEEINWESAKSLNQIVPYGVFLQRYPNGRFSQEARDRLKYLLCRKITKEKIPSHISGDVTEAIEKLYSKDAVERGNAARRLGNMGTKAEPAIPFLVRTLDDCTSLIWGPWPNVGQLTYVGNEAAKALAKLGDPGFEALLITMRYGYGCARRNAIRGLGKTDNPVAVEQLIVKLNDQSVDRDVVAIALGELKDPRAVQPLITALKDWDVHVQQCAAIALGEIGDSRAVEPLIDTLKAEKWVVRNSAADALREITGQDFDEDDFKWKQWWEENKQRVNR